ncbi:immunity protein YezG family protein [Loigolactobacillus backii]|uniref:immunity protein YezG family protein n=1 Tax=Loigolactobacillus backii TaxID=375175 RepID=UPI0013043FF0|nr:immunity protein YezG family protein [Loigolactobacillus backii]
MSIESELGEVYNQIITKINDMIPSTWADLIFYAEVNLKQGGEAYFYYSLQENPYEYHFSNEIPDDFGVSMKIYSDLNYELYKITEKLQKIFERYHQRPWYSFIMRVDVNLKMQAKFDYVNWNKSDFGPVARQAYFEYKYLDKKFTDPEMRHKIKLMQRYEESGRG